MANPVNVPLPKGVWVKVATAVVTGRITIKEWQASNYWQTYRLTGEAAPTDTTTATLGFKPEILLQSQEDSDFYMMARVYSGSVVVSV